MILHEFLMADVEDPYLYAGFPIAEWQATEKGQWVMQNVTEEPIFHIYPNVDTMGYRVVITGNLSPKQRTYFTLKFQ
jgi:hypothetical protein